MKINKMNYLLAFSIYGVVMTFIYANGWVSTETMKIEYIFLVPAGFVIATVAMASGISGSNFWIPVYISVVHVDPRLSFWLALFTMIFGFGSGVLKQVQLKTIRFDIANRYLLISIPSAMFGAMVVLPRIQTPWLLIGFGCFVAIYGYRLATGKKEILKGDQWVTDVIFAIGAILKGTIATGLGKLASPRLMQHSGLSPPVVIGTVVYIVFVTNIVAVPSILTNDDFYDSLINNWESLFCIMTFVILGVVTGGQVGPQLVQKVKNKEDLKKIIGVLLMIVSYFMIMRGVALL